MSVKTELEKKGGDEKKKGTEGNYLRSATALAEKSPTCREVFWDKSVERKRGTGKPYEAR